MIRPSPSVTRSPVERLWAWLYTGPLGHLYGIVADISVMWARYGWSRLKNRRP